MKKFSTLVLIILTIMANNVLGEKLQLIDIDSVKDGNYQFTAYEEPDDGKGRIEENLYYIKVYNTVKKKKLCVREIYRAYYRKNMPLDNYGKRDFAIKYYPKKERHNRITSLKIAKEFLVIKNEEGKKYLVRITDVSKFCGKKQYYSDAYKVSKVATLFEPLACKQLNQTLGRLDYGKVYFQFLYEWEKHSGWRNSKQEKKYLSQLNLKAKKGYLRNKILINKKYIHLFQKAERSMSQLIALKLAGQKLLLKDLNRYDFQGTMRLIIMKYYQSATPEIKALLSFQKSLNAIDLKSFSDPDYLAKRLLIPENKGRGWIPNNLYYPFINYYGSVEPTRIYLENNISQQHNLDYQLLQRSGGTKIYPGSFSKGCMVNVELAKKPYNDIVRLSFKKAIGFYYNALVSSRGYRNSIYWEAITYKLTVSQMALISRKLHAIKVIVKPASFFTRSAKVNYDPKTKILTITHFYKKASICFKGCRGTWYKLSSYTLRDRINNILSINTSQKKKK